MVYFTFLSEIWSKNQFRRVWSEVYSMDLLPLAARYCKRNSSFKIRTGDVRPQRGGKKYQRKKPVVGSVPQVKSPDGVQVQVQLCQFTARLRYGVAAQRLAATAARQRWRPEPLTHDRSAATRRPRHWHHGRSM